MPLNIITFVNTALLGFLRASCWGYGPYGGFFGMGGFGMMIFMALFWIALAVLLVWGLARLFGMKRTVEAMDVASSLEILKRRLASGEITEKEYERLKKTISTKAV